MRSCVGSVTWWAARAHCSRGGDEPASHGAARRTDFGKREIERIGQRIKKLLDLLLDDEIGVNEGKAEIKALDARRKELQAQLKTADEAPPLLHPVRQSERDRGARPGLTTTERDEFKRLQRENGELKRANEILKKAATFFAQAELDRRPK